MSSGPDNFDRLRDAGVIHAQVPKEYQSIIDELDDAQLEVVVGIFERLEQVDRETGPEPGRLPRWVTWMFF